LFTSISGGGALFGTNPSGHDWRGSTSVSIHSWSSNAPADRLFVPAAIAPSSRASCRKHVRRTLTSARHAIAAGLLARVQRGIGTFEQAFGGFARDEFGHT